MTEGVFFSVIRIWVVCFCFVFRASNFGFPQLLYFFLLLNGGGGFPP
jgi:hypothetical protein